MLVIAAALACATLKLGFLGILLLVALAALLIQRLAARYFMGVPGGALIVVSLPGDDDAGATKEVTDPYQAVMFRDRTQPDARWFWVNWDMDHSFMDFFRRDLDPWSQDSFSGTLRWPAFEARIIGG